MSKKGYHLDEVIGKLQDEFFESRDLIHAEGGHHLHQAVVATLIME